MLRLPGARSRACLGNSGAGSGCRGCRCSIAGRWQDMSIWGGGGGGGGAGMAPEVVDAGLDEEEEEEDVEGLDDELEIDDKLELVDDLGLIVELDRVDDEEFKVLDGVAKELELLVAVTDDEVEV